MNRSLLAAWTALGFMLCAGVVAAVWQTVLKQQGGEIDWPAWVQAVGSVGAIGVAICIDRGARLEDRARARKALMAARSARMKAVSDCVNVLRLCEDDIRRVLKRFDALSTFGAPYGVRENLFAALRRTVECLVAFNERGEIIADLLWLELCVRDEGRRALEILAPCRSNPHQGQLMTALDVVGQAQANIRQAMEAQRRGID